MTITQEAVYVIQIYYREWDHSFDIFFIYIFLCKIYTQYYQINH